jgi:APA family basic amino acid/polyamine antiporter
VTWLPRNKQTRSGALRGSIGRFQLFSLAFGAILGAGWIVAVGDWLRAAGPLGTVCAFVAGAAVLSLIAACYAELGKLYPVTGGEVIYAERLFNREIAFYTGWFLAIVYVGVCAFSAISLGWIIEALAPGSSGPVLYTVLGHAIHFMGLTAGLTAVALVWAVNHSGVRAATRLQDALTVTMIAAFIAFVVVGLMAGRTANLDPWFGSGESRVGWSGIVQVFVTSPFWFSGFAVVSQALGEQADSAERRALGPVFLSAIGMACLFYCLVVIAAAAALPRADLLVLDLPAAGAFATTFHSAWLAKLVLTIGLLGLLIALNAIFYSATRVLFALARGGMFPEPLGVLNSRGAPVVACLIVALLSAFGTILGRGAIEPLVDATAIILSGIYLMVCVAAGRARRNKKITAAWLPRVASFCTFLLIGTSLYLTWHSSHRGMPPELTLLVVATGLGLLFRLWRRATIDTGKSYH